MIDINDIFKISQLQNFKIHESWENFFSNKYIQKEFFNIINTLNKQKVNMNPPLIEQALYIFTKDIEDFKIICLGQDPYPALNSVKTRAFEVQNLNDWTVPFKQKSLQNILRLLYKSYTGKEKCIKEIRIDIENNNFNILPPNKIFDYWESQGVYFINRYPTCEVNKPKSHKSIWINFTNEIFKYISFKKSKIIWFLWGNDAKEIKYIINNNGIFYISKHPRLNNKNDKNSFLNSKCFEETKNIIKWLNDKQ